MKSLKGAWIGVALCLMLACFSAYAQQANVGNITGTVNDATGAVVPGANVAAVNQGTNLTYPAVTTSGGDYFINVLPVGKYTVTVTKAGFEKVTRTDIDVLAGQTTTANMTLQVGASTQTITVSGTVTAINTTDTNQGTTRSPEELQQLPISMEGTQLARRSVRCKRCRE